MAMPSVPKRVVDQGFVVLNTVHSSHPEALVLKVMDNASNKHYAVKILTMSSNSPSGLHAELREEVIQWRIGHNIPNICTVHEAWTELYPVPRLCIRSDWTGTTIYNYLCRGSRFYGPPWIEIMKGIANGLSGIHHFGVFHGDLTCGNIRVNINDYDGSIPFDHVFISNLGIHHWFAKWNPKTHQMMKIPATQQYCAPEVLEDGREEVSIQSDIWAVGCIGAEILTGRPLFPTEQAVELYTERGVVDDAQNALFAMHPQISKILMGCLQKDKAKRWRVWQLQDHIEQARQAFAIESQRNAVIRAIDTANRRLV